MVVNETDPFKIPPMKLEDVLDDLCARFIINLPEEERSSFERLGFQVEQAFWFYDDFYRPSHPHLPRLTLRSFGKILLQRYPPLIAPFGRNFDKLYEEFMAYKLAIPVCGAIILNETLTKCLVVKGWSSKASWGFPKGKIGKDEDPADCAVREVFEETGYDIGPLISSTNFIDAHTTTTTTNSSSGTNQQSTRLFIIPNVPESTVFTPQTRKEISKIQWHPIESLPTKYGQDNSFYNVINFVKKLKLWIKTVRLESSKKKKNPNNNNQKNAEKKNSSSYASLPSSKAAPSPVKQNQKQAQDIFDKLRSKNDQSPVNSLLMRDNPSPIHLFEKLSSEKKPEKEEAEEGEQQVEVQVVELSCQDRLFNAIEKFALGLKSLKINRSVIREAINKA